MFCTIGGQLVEHMATCHFHSHYCENMFYVDLSFGNGA